MRKGFSTGLCLILAISSQTGHLYLTSPPKVENTLPVFSVLQASFQRVAMLSSFFDKTIQVNYKKMKHSSQLYLSCELEYSNLINWTIQMI